MGTSKSVEEASTPKLHHHHHHHHHYTLRLACDNHQIIQALEAISALNAKEDLEVSKLKHLLDQTKTSKTTTPLASSNNQETSAATSNIINVIAKNNSQPKSPCPKKK